MSETLTLTAQLSPGDGRTLRGIIVPPGSEFPRGSFTRTIAERGSKVTLIAGEHNGRPFVVGTASELRETDAGLSAVFTVVPGEVGDLVLQRSIDVAWGVQLRKVTDQEYSLQRLCLGGPRDTATERGLPISVARRRLALLEAEWEAL